MKCFLLICLFGLTTSEAAKKFYSDCTNVMGGFQVLTLKNRAVTRGPGPVFQFQPVNGSTGAAGCPEGTHRGYVECSEHSLPEPTCYDPKPLPIRNMVCVYSNLCYCNPPTVRDQMSNRCVPIHECGLSSESGDE